MLQTLITNAHLFLNQSRPDHRSSSPTESFLQVGQVDVLRLQKIAEARPDQEEFIITIIN